MNSYLKHSEAFQIFSKYENSKDLNATNGNVYAGPTPDAVSKEDRARLKELGWSEKSVDGTFCYSV